MSPLTTTGMDTALLDLAHGAPVGAALEELAARARVHGDQLHAGGLGAARQLGGVAARVVPAQPHLQRDGHAHGADDRFDQRQGVIEVAHQRAARQLARHLARRAAHVDVDDVGAEPLGDAGALRHPARLAAGELYDEGDSSRPSARRRTSARWRTSCSLATISETTSPAPRRVQDGGTAGRSRRTWARAGPWWVRSCPPMSRPPAVGVITVL